MPVPDRYIHRVNNMHEALELAQGFKANGTYDLFRGQAQNWKVMPTGMRGPEEGLGAIQEKLKRLMDFFYSDSLLSRYADHIDWFFAVAQHYGLPTNYIDFSKNPEVAMYFATHDKACVPGESAAIVCLNRADFEDFWRFIEPVYGSKTEGMSPPYIADVDIANLWRLQAQQGAFLFTPWIDFESLYNFDRILFPFESPYRRIRKSMIYPMRKSELEIQLDHYFDDERRIIGSHRMREMAAELGIPIASAPEQDFSEAMTNTEPHHSWSFDVFQRWQFLLKDSWPQVVAKNRICIEIGELGTKKACFQNVHRQLIGQTHKLANRQTSLLVSFKRADIQRLNNATLARKMCALIWDGCRNLPFETKDIVKIIAHYISIHLFENAFEAKKSMNGMKLVLLEMSSEVMGISRSHAEEQGIVNAFRDDLCSLLHPRFKGRLHSEFLLWVYEPRLVFDFEKLVQLFIEEVIPYQVWKNRHETHPVIVFNPAQLRTFGYA